MNRPLARPNPLSRLWRVDAPLTLVALLMLGALAFSLAGLVLDPRSITGAPAWMKPAKFAVSTAIFSGTLVWVFTYLPEWSRTRRVAGWVTAVTFVVEVAIIDLQAWRGTTSHFNTSSALDAALFGVMGTGILVQTLATLAVTVALWRQTFSDRALGWALRLGMTISILGAATGGLMTQPTSAQLAKIRSTGTVPDTVGAHTMGGPDGGPGVPGTGWSLDHGYLRVPHFVGLHALQVLPLLVLALPRQRVSEQMRIRAALVAAVSYVTLFAILLWQALGGRSFAAPDAATGVALVVWAGMSLAALAMGATRARPMATFGGRVGH